MDLTRFLIMFLFPYCGIVTAIALTSNKASFGAGWVVLLWILAFSRILWTQFIDWSRAPKVGDDIAYNEWLNQLTPEYDEARPRRASDKVSVHYRPWITCSILSLSFLFIVIGIIYRRNPNCRWLIALGFMGLGELVTRWFVEWSHRPGGWRRTPELRLHPEHEPIYREFFEESRATKWCKSLFRSFK
jgi:hypothetical protein